jgi:hypothetical protein
MKTCAHRAAVHSTAATPRARLDLLVLLGLTAVFVLSATWRPSELPSFVLCPFRALTGLPCPGCGMTRAFCALGHGEWRLAVGFNALSPLVFVAALGAWAWAAAGLFKLRWARAAFARLRPSPRAGGVLLALTLVWWLARLAGGF